MYASKATFLMKGVWLWLAGVLSVEGGPAGAVFLALPLILFTCIPYKLAEFSSSDVLFYPMFGLSPESIPQGALVLSERPRSFSIGGYFGATGVSQVETILEIQDGQGKVVWRRRFLAAADKGDFTPLLSEVAALRDGAQRA